MSDDVSTRPASRPFTRLALIGAGIVCLLFLLLGWWYSFSRWERQYFGEVLRLTERGFVMSDPDSKERSVRTDSKTEIRRGRAKGILLTIGDHVIILGELEGTELQARFIRVVENNFVPPTLLR